MDAPGNDEVIEGPAGEELAGTEADVADVLDQVEPADGEPVADALQQAEDAPFEDRREDERIAEDAEEAAGGA